MRFAMAVGACVLWASVAYAQANPDMNHAGSGIPAASEPSSSQAQTSAPTPEAQTPNSALQNQTTDANHQVICHTSVATGSRLARHATRICKTRQQWELDQQQDQEIMRHIGTVQGQTG